MHEFGITQDLIDEVTRQAQANKIKKVTQIEIALGRLSDLTPRALRVCFKALAGDEELDLKAIPDHHHSGPVGDHDHQAEIKQLVYQNKGGDVILKGAKLVIKKTADHKIIINKIEGKSD